MQNLEVDDDGEVRFAFLLRPDDPGDLVKEARARRRGASHGVAAVKVNVQLPQMAGSGGGAPGWPQARLGARAHAQARAAARRWGTSWR